MAGHYTESNSKKHIVFFTPGFPGSEKDDQCIPALQVFARELADNHNIRLSIIAFQYPYFKKQFSWFGHNVNALGGRNKKGFSKYFLWKKAEKTFREIHRETPVNLVHSFWMGECALLGQNISDELNIPHLCTLMGQDVLKGNPWFSRIHEIPALITLSAFQAKVLKQNYQLQPDAIIPWGVEKADYAEVERYIDVLGVGNLIPLKRFDNFLEIICRLKSLKTDIRVEIVGDGPERWKLEKMIHEKALSSNVKLTGKLSRSDVLRKMQSARVFLHTSEYESFGMVLAEAMDRGENIISTPVGLAFDTEEIIELDSPNAEEQIMILLDKENIRKQKFLIKDTVEAYLKLWSERQSIL